MLQRRDSSAKGTWWALLGALLLSVLLWPGAWILGESVYATDVIFAPQGSTGSLPWRAEFGDLHAHNGELGDQGVIFFGQIAEGVRTLHEDDALPTWNPSTYGGVPLSANVQIPMLDPLHWALAWFQPEGEPFSSWHLALGLTWTGILRFLICLFFCFLWLRQVCGRPVLSFLAAAAFAAGPYAALWWWSTPGQVLSFLPLALYCLERRLRGGSVRWLAGAALGLTLSHYGGYPQTTIFLVLFVLGYVLWHGEVHGKRRHRLYETLLVIGISGLLALPLFLPFLHYLEHSWVAEIRQEANAALRAGFGWSQFWSGLVALGLLVFAWRLPQRSSSLPCARALGSGLVAGLGLVALRHAGGDGDALYWLFPGVAGHPLSSIGYVGERLYIETNQDHVGLLALLLIVAALRGRAARVAFFGLIAVLLLASGAGPIAAPVRALVPLIEPSRAASLVPPLLALALALAGRRLLAFPDSERPRELQIAAFGVMGLLLVLFGDHLVQSSVSFAERGTLPEVPASSWFGVLRDDRGDLWGYSGLIATYTRLPRMGLGTLFALGTLLACMRGAPRTQLFAKALFAFACGLVLWPGYGFQPSVPRDQVFPQTESLRWLQEQKDADPELRIYAPNARILPGSTASVYGLDRVLGVDGFDPREYVYLACHLPRDPQLVDKRALWRAEAMQLDSSLFDLFGARLVLAIEGSELPAHFVERFVGDGLVIAENPRALPRFQLLGEAVSLDEDPRALLALDLRKTVGISGAKSLELPGPPMKQGQVEVLERGPNGAYVVRTQSDGAAWLLMLDSDLPGWRVFVDGQEQPLHKANLVFRAVQVPAGEHRVRFAYEPPGLRLGGYAALLGGLLALLVLLRPGWLGLGRGPGEIGGGSADGRECGPSPSAAANRRASVEPEPETERVPVDKVPGRRELE
jgi:hypothetical protein